MNTKTLISTLFALAMVACGGSEQTPDPKDPGNQIDPGTNPNPVDPCSVCTSNQMCMDNQCVEKPPPVTVDPHACDGLQIIAGTWHAMTDGEEADITTTPDTKGCAVVVSGPGASWDNPGRPIYATALPVENTTDGIYVGIKMDNTHLVLADQTPGTAYFEKKFQR